MMTSIGFRSGGPTKSKPVLPIEQDTLATVMLATRAFDILQVASGTSPTKHDPVIASAFPAWLARTPAPTLPARHNAEEQHREAGAANAYSHSGFGAPRTSVASDDRSTVRSESLAAEAFVAVADRSVRRGRDDFAHRSDGAHQSRAPDGAA